MLMSAPRLSMAALAAARIRATESARLCHCGNLGQLIGDLVEYQLDLHARQVRANAVVRAVTAESQARIGITQNVEFEGSVEDVVVEVSRAVEQTGPLALSDRDTADLGILAGGPLETVHRRRPTDDFVGGGLRALAFVQFPLLGILGKGTDAVRHGVAGGLVPG